MHPVTFVLYYLNKMFQSRKFSKSNFHFFSPSYFQGSASYRMQFILRRRRSRQSADVKTRPIGLRSMEQIDWLLPRFQYVGRDHSGSDGKS